jgi:hypothetical protein
MSGKDFPRNAEQAKGAAKEALANDGVYVLWITYGTFLIITDTTQRALLWQQLAQSSSPWFQ